MYGFRAMGDYGVQIAPWPPKRKIFEEIQSLRGCPELEYSKLENSVFCDFF